MSTPPRTSRACGALDSLPPFRRHRCTCPLRGAGAVVEAVRGRRPGVLDVEANPVAQTATVSDDPRVTSLAELRRRVEQCGYHCAGQSVPAHVCDPMLEPDPPADGHAGHGAAAPTMPVPPAAADPAEHAAAHAGHATAPGEAVRSPEEVMGHGGRDHQQHQRADRQPPGLGGEGRTPASVTLTSRRTAAADDRLPAAVRACRQ